MNLAYKGLIAAGIAGTGGIGAYYGIKMSNTIKVPKIKDQLKGRFLPSNDSVKWGERLNDLKALASSTSLSSELSSFKESIASKTWEHIRDLCFGISNREFKDKEDKVFTEVITYCTYKNKDKLGDKVINENTIGTKWQSVNGKLKDAIGILSSTMTNIKQQIGTNTNTATQLKEWCNGVYNKPFVNDSNVEFADAKVYCVSS